MPNQITPTTLTLTAGEVPTVQAPKAPKAPTAKAPTAKAPTAPTTATHYTVPTALDWQQASTGTAQEALCFKHFGNGTPPDYVRVMAGTKQPAFNGRKAPTGGERYSHGNAILAAIQAGASTVGEVIAACTVVDSKPFKAANGYRICAKGALRCAMQMRVIFVLPPFAS